MKRTIAILLTAVLLVVINFAYSVSASDLPYLSLTDCEAQTGETVTLTLSTSQTIKNVVGMKFKISYDPSQISFENRSIKVLQSAIDSSLINKGNASDGKVYFTYTGDITSPITVQKGNIASFGFTVTGSGFDSSKVYLTVEELYQNELENVSTANREHTAKITITKDKVSEVTAKINSIGAVVYPDSYDILTDARASYNLLTSAEKQAVKNSDILVSAEGEFLRLKNLDEAQKNNNAANEWKTKWSAILSKKPAYAGDNALQLSDKSTVRDAINDYDTKSVAVRNLLNEQINYLNKLQEYFSVIESIEDAKETIKSFDDNYSGFYNYTVDTVTSEELTGLGYAVKAIDNINSTFSDISEWIEANFGDKARLIKALYEKSNAISLYENSDATKAYNSYMDGYGSWITKEKEQITKDDFTDLSLAVQAYELLSPDAQKLVGDQFYKHISDLKNYAENCEETEDDVSETDDESSESSLEDEEETEDEIDDKSEDKVLTAGASKDSQKTVINISSKGISIVVWALMISLGVLILLLGGLIFIRFSLNKKLKLLTIAEMEVADE